MKGLQISKLLAASLGVILANPTLAQNSLDIGVVLDGSYQNEARHWGSRDEGFALGHSELVLSSNIDHHFKGQLVSVLASHGGETELELEEAWIETLSLPFGAKLKAGRMLSNIGYLNSKHMHEDAFVERPAVYRALLGGHYFDDGVQLSWLLPTDFYLQTSFEILSGKSIDAGYKDPVTLGVYTANLQIGADLGVEHSWRWGISSLYNANGRQFSAEHTHAAHRHAHDHVHDHAGHSHGPSFTGRNLYGTDFTWKWAPEGNYRQSNVRATSEFWYLDNRFDEQMSKAPGAEQNAHGWYAELAYQFLPSWTVSTRYGEMRTVDGDVHAHIDHFHGEFSRDDLKELDLALDWHASHFGRVRGQVTYEKQIHRDETLFSLQYVMSFGAHHAHAF
ncbi:TonB-dependent receptor [Vibrio tarriae]|uniref:TonB-dependent receptor n=1 Tax=Vibrio tarriae TaxID=2014742 RepID=UPI000DE1B423|nr:TonB-dependent receptor [Vibrio tarriae]QEO43975.1 TonB-dependent receptor [Vibrio cholerae]RBM28590.1 TonB-dependent receptor [Vibrio tarriae]RBM28730.1 TonB-dependent receptor [Vibrio tarriae]RBM34638.1 TonB-dependent receptor [Vibrio tarriae]RBM39063.1 TonB-dependent receptor [Vibrio tarriae]